MDNAKVGSLISSLRKEKGLSQKALADAIGVTDKAVSKWETGRGSPEISLLVPLSEELDITVAELLNGERVPQEAKIAQSNNKIVEVLKNNKQKLMLSTAAVIFVIAVLISIYPAYHFFTSVRAGDTAAIGKRRERLFDTPSLSVIEQKSKSGYTAVLLKGEASYKTALLKRDKLFKSRVEVIGGTNAGKNDIGCYCTSDGAYNMIIMAGYDISEKEYSFRYKGTKLTCEIDRDKNTVLDLFVESTEQYSSPYDIRINRSERAQDFVKSFFDFMSRRIMLQ